MLSSPTYHESKHRFFCTFLIHILLCTGTFVHGWGKDGHEIVANIAYSRLSARAKRAVKKILQDDYYRNDPKDINIMSTSPLAKVANWADEIRFRSNARWTEPLHFIDIPEKDYSDGCAVNSLDCQFEYERDCVDDVCVAGSISNYTRRLYEQYWSAAGDVERLGVSAETKRVMLRGGSARDFHRDDIFGSNTAKESLLFVTHFIGDIHQPLHVAREGDKGGNSIHVSFSMHPRALDDMTSSSEENLHHGKNNLHKVWDSEMIDRAIDEVYGGSQSKFCDDIMRTINRSDAETAWLECPDGRDKKCVSQWASESLFEALHSAYANEYSVEIDNGDVISDVYYRKRLDVVKRRLAMGGVRLAAALEVIFASDDHNDDDEGNDEDDDDDDGVYDAFVD